MKKLSYSFKSRTLCIALFVFSAVLKAVSRKYPSPARPNPEPGVPTTLARPSSRSKNSQDAMPPGVFSHT